ncbi:MAG: PHP domain-containing protein [Asgard group archaeon]|nr:PHP domain-containing protein [Asgard group archaeon]
MSFLKKIIKYGLVIMTARKRLLMITIKFAILVVGYILLVGVGVLAANYRPAEYSYTDTSFDWSYSPDYNETEFNIIYDHHSHTFYSDGILSVEHNILWHIAHGFNTITISDHNKMLDPDEFNTMATKYAGQIILIPGMEYTSSRIHMNFLGITEMIPVTNNPSDEEIQEAIDAAHAQGGIVIVNHIPWSLPRMPTHPTKAQLLAWGVDYIELVNEDVYDYDSDAWCNNTGGFGKITGTDMHRPMDVSGWTLMKADNFTAAGVMKELFLRNTEIIYDYHGSKDHSIGTPKVSYKILEPFISFGEYFANLGLEGGFVNWQAFGVGFAYMTIIFGMFQAAKFGFEKRRERKTKPKTE